MMTESKGSNMIWDTSHNLKSGRTRSYKKIKIILKIFMNEGCLVKCLRSVKWNFGCFSYYLEYVESSIFMLTSSLNIVSTLCIIRRAFVMSFWCAIPIKIIITRLTIPEYRLNEFMVTVTKLASLLLLANPSDTLIIWNVQ